MRIASIGSATFLALMALGQAQAAPTGKFLEGFTVDNVSAILRDMGATELATETVENDPRVNFTLEQRHYTADFYGCEDKAKGCKALQFFIAFEANPTDTIAAVNEFNRRYLYGKAALDKDNTLLSMRMVNGFAGILDSQVAAELTVLAGVTDVLLDHMKQTPVASYTPQRMTTQLSHAPQQLLTRASFKPNKR